MLISDKEIGGFQLDLKQELLGMNNEHVPYTRNYSRCWHAIPGQVVGKSVGEQTLCPTVVLALKRVRRTTIKLMLVVVVVF